MSGNLTMLLAKSRDTEYFLKNDIPMSTFPIVGRTMNVSSKTLPPMKSRSNTCFLTRTMLPLAIRTLNSGRGVPGGGRLGVLKEFVGVLLPTVRSGSRQCQGDKMFVTKLERHIWHLVFSIELQCGTQLSDFVFRFFRWVVMFEG